MARKRPAASGGRDRKPTRSARPPSKRSANAVRRPAGKPFGPKSVRTKTGRPTGSKAHAKAELDANTDARGPNLSPSKLAEAIAEIALEVEPRVLDEGRRADRALAFHFRRRQSLGPVERREIADAVASLFRWRGWIAPLLPRDSQGVKRLLLCALMDAEEITTILRQWARTSGIEPSRLIALGDAPSWTARAETLKLWAGQPQYNADPWRLFPDWFREVVPLPPGSGSAKVRRLDFLTALQRRPALWIRARNAEPSALWSRLRREGISFEVHQHKADSARLDRRVEVAVLSAFLEGFFEVQDLGVQAIAAAADPEPGERWWVAGVGGGHSAIHLADLMGGKGQVVATDGRPAALKGVVQRVRRFQISNVATKTWDGAHVVGKAGRYHGVLVEAASSGIGSWRRQPEARWTLDTKGVDALPEAQRQALHVAAQGVRPGGLLVYTVATLNPAETRAVVEAFLEDHPGFQIDPFPHPFRDGPTDGYLNVWPQIHDAEARFIARMVRAD